VPSWQVPLPSQQPLQVDGLHDAVTHTAPSQSWSKSHEVHAAPPVPQSKT
jgi:hypothetical protein